MVANGRERKDQRDSGPQLRLVFFDDHDIIPSLVSNRLRNVAWGQEGIHRDHPTFQDPWREDGLDGRDLIGFVVHGVWGSGHAYLVRQRREQVGPRRALFFGTAQRVPIAGSRGLRGLRSGGQTPDDTVGPGTQVGLERVPVHVPKDGMERGRTGRGMGEAEGLRDACALMASPFGHGTIAASTT